MPTQSSSIIPPFLCSTTIATRNILQKHFGEASGASASRAAGAHALPPAAPPCPGHQERARLPQRPALVGDPWNRCDFQSVPNLGQCFCQSSGKVGHGRRLGDRLALAGGGVGVSFIHLPAGHGQQRVQNEQPWVPLSCTFDIVSPEEPCN